MLWFGTGVQVCSWTEPSWGWDRESEIIPVRALPGTFILGLKKSHTQHPHAGGEGRLFNSDQASAIGSPSVDFGQQLGRQRTLQSDKS